MSHNQVTLSEAIDAFLRNPRIRAGVDEARVKQLWAQLMGPAIARYTTDIQLHRERLTLTISSAPLKNELFYSREKIKELLNRELGHEAIKQVQVQ